MAFTHFPRIFVLLNILFFIEISAKADCPTIKELEEKSGGILNLKKSCEDTILPTCRGAEFKKIVTEHQEGVYKPLYSLNKYKQVMKAFGRTCSEEKMCFRAKFPNLEDVDIHAYGEKIALSCITYNGGLRKCSRKNETDPAGENLDGIRKYYVWTNQAHTLIINCLKDEWSWEAMSNFPIVDEKEKKMMFERLKKMGFKTDDANVKCLTEEYKSDYCVWTMPREHPNHNVTKPARPRKQLLSR